jgi:hypothetical protein
MWWWLLPKIQAEAKSLRLARDASIRKEQPSAHAQKHDAICAELSQSGEKKNDNNSNMKLKRSKLIGHIGMTGNGKSSFINAQRGLFDMDPSAAKTDYVECTMNVWNQFFADKRIGFRSKTIVCPMMNT